MKENPDYWRKLVGAGISWALWDFLQQGIFISQPTLVKEIFGEDTYAFDLMW